MTETLNLSIDGMHCAACVRRVTNALQGVDGVTVNLVEVGSAKVTFDTSKTDAQQVVAAVDRIGFAAKFAS
ncbi:MAG: heavy-metal-associated domain-containing protein [Acidobacteria bacterium]|nr:heavy-metal-associated domain-containing protein [Acidobacteriota bacterium]